eukprot:g9886.t1
MTFVVEWPKIIPIHTDNITTLQAVFLLVISALLVAAVVLCRLRCTRFRQQRRLNQHAEIINVPLLNDVEAEQSALRETFQENDDDYGEYIGKVNLLTSPEVFRELQETRLQQNIDERNLNPQKDRQDVFDASAAPSCTSIDIHGENDAKLDLTILEKLQGMARSGSLFLDGESLKVSKRIAFSDTYRPHIWQFLLENNCRSNFETLDQGDGVKSDTSNVLHGDRAVRRRFSEPMRKQPISEEVMQLLELDVARSRFVQTDTERKELLELLTLWLYMLPKGGEYRQGADTLAAICYRVFSSLKKTETGARMMLMTCRKFIPAYFTDGKNNKYLEQRLCLFSSLLCFWDPQVASHLKMAGVSPAMFSVPWFVTLFGDIWPLEKVLYLWDALFVIGPDFLVFVAITIVSHSTNRAKLLTSNFSQCLSFLSSLNRGEVTLNLRHCVLKAISMYSQTPKSLLHYQNEEHVDIAHRHLTQQFQNQSFGRYVPGSTAKEWSTGQFAEVDDGKNLALVISLSDLSSLPESSSVLLDLRNCTDLDHSWLIDTCSNGAPTFHFPKLLELQEKVAETMEREERNVKKRGGIVAKLTSKRKARLINLRSSEEIILLLSKIKPFLGRYVILCVWENTDCSNIVEVLVRAGVPRVCTFLVDRKMQYAATMYMLQK